MKLNLTGTIEKSSTGFNGFMGKLSISYVIYLYTGKSPQFDKEFIDIWYDNYKKI